MEVNAFHINQMQDKLFTTMAKRVSEGASAVTKRYGRYTLYPVDYIVAALEHPVIAPHVAHVVRSAGLQLDELQDMAASMRDRDDVTVRGKKGAENTLEVPAVETKAMLIKLRQSYEGYLTESAETLREVRSSTKTGGASAPPRSTWDWTEQLIAHALRAITSSDGTDAQS